MSASLKKSARQLASTYFHSLSEEDREEFLNELRNEPPSTKKSSKRSSKKEDSDGEDKPKRAPSEWNRFCSTVSALLKETVKPSLKEGEKMVQGVHFKIASKLQAEKEEPTAERVEQLYHQWLESPWETKTQNERSSKKDSSSSKASSPAHSEDEAEEKEEPKKAPATPKKEAPKKKEAVPKKPVEEEEEKPVKKEAPKKEAPKKKEPVPKKPVEEEEELPPMETELWKHKGKVYMRSTEEPHFCWLWNEKTAEQGAYKGVYDEMTETFDESYPEPGL